MVFNRGEAGEAAIIGEWEDGFGWFAHPTEEGKRASYAFAFDDGVWIVDPIYADGVEDRIADLGTVVGIAVCSSWHARDADLFAERYDVPIFIPEAMSRIANQVEAPIRRYENDLDDAGVEVFHRHPFPRADEAILFHERTGTLYIPDSFGTTPGHTVGDERIGLDAFMRLSPPTDLLCVEPDRICCGHGGAIFEDASSALEDAIKGGRRRFPRAIVRQLPARIRIIVAALRG